MKTFLAALAATLALAAQAASIDWDQVEGAVSLGTKTASGSIDVGTGANQANLGSGSWVISAQLTAGAINNYKNDGQKYPSIIGVSLGDDGDVTRFNASCADKNSGDIGLAGTKKPTTTGTTVQLASNNVYDFVISFDNETQTISFYINDSLYGTLANVSSAPSAIVWGAQNKGGNKQNLWNNNADTYTMDINYVAGMTYDEVKASLVPEPGVLALLALGVAGLALRRRAA